MKKKFTLFLAVFLTAFSSNAAITFYSISAAPSTTSAVITFSISNSTAPFNTNMNIFYDTVNTSLNNDIGSVIFSGSSVVNTTRSIIGLLPGTKYYYQLKSGLVRSAIDSFTTTGTLPLNIVSFSATQKGNTTLLKWTSENEINVSHFNIQHSINGKDFETIGTINAGKNNYEFIDNKLPSIYEKFTINYRLQIVDKDGSKTYSIIKHINVNARQQNFNISLYPTIATSTVNIAFETNNCVNIYLQIINTNGQIVDTKNMKSANGANVFCYDCSKLDKGIYFINFSSNGELNATMKFNKQ